MRWRSRVLLLCVLFVLSPLTAIAQDQVSEGPGGLPGTRETTQQGEFTVAATIVEEWGNRGLLVFGDDASQNGVGCYNVTGNSTGTIDVAVRGPALRAYYEGGQYVGWRARLYQWNPDGSVTWIASSNEYQGFAYQSTTSKFDDISFPGLPQGPIYVVQVEVAWYLYGAVDGYRRYWMDYYGEMINSRDTGRFNACFPVFTAGAALHSSRGTVNSKVYLTGAFFPLWYPATVQWGSKTIATLTTSDRGTFAGYLRVPATPMGTYTVVVNAGNGYTANAGTYTVIPRIKVIEGTVARGQTVNISLRGFAKKESVRIRWKNPSGSWIEVARVTTSNTGSANAYVTVPSWAPNGAASVRGDGPSGRAQTNAVYVSGGATLAVASVSMPPASPTATPSVTATAPTETETPAATASVTETVTATATATATVTESPTEAPTETVTPVETTETPPTEMATEWPTEESTLSPGS